MTATVLDLPCAERVLVAAELDPRGTSERLLRLWSGEEPTLHAEYCPNLTDQQVLNLVSLARWLRTLPADYKEFDMADYHRGTTLADHAWYPCGTTACAVGHGPAAGIKPNKNEDWSSYEHRVFGMELFDPLFCGSWGELDNTPRGAAARICMILSPDPLPLAGGSSDEAVAAYQMYVD